MKIRTSFVSNSSSSSFLVAFPRNPKSAADVKAMLFGDKEVYANPYVWNEDDDTGWPADEVAAIVWRDMEKQIPNNKNFIFSKISNPIDYDTCTTQFVKANPTDDWDNIDWDAVSEAGKDKILQFMKDNRDCFFYCFTYADDEGRLSAAMEHGGLFDGLPHLVSSNH